MQLLEQVLPLGLVRRLLLQERAHAEFTVQHVSPVVVVVGRRQVLQPDVLLPVRRLALAACNYVPKIITIKQGVL